MTHVTMHRPLFLHHYWTVSAGEQARRRSLLVLFFGVPAAAMVWRLWSLVFVGPSAEVQPQRFEGWGRVVVQLPGSLLVVGVVTAAVVLAARAKAARVAGADLVLGVVGAGFLGVLLVLGVTVLHTVEPAPSAAARLGVLAAALVATVCAVLAAYTWARDARR